MAVATDGVTGELNETETLFEVAVGVVRHAAFEVSIQFTTSKLVKEALTKVDPVPTVPPFKFHE